MSISRYFDMTTVVTMLSHISFRQMTVEMRQLTNAMTVLTDCH